MLPRAVARFLKEERRREERPRFESDARIEPEKERGIGLVRGLGEPLPRKFLEFRTSNH